MSLKNVQIAERLELALQHITTNGFDIVPIKNTLINKRGLTEGEANACLYGMVQLSGMSDEMLFWITDAIEQEAKMKYFDVDCTTSWFDREDIIVYSKSKRENKKGGDIYPIVFDNTVQLTDDQWVTTITAQQLHKLYSNQLVVYNRETQRPMKQKTAQGIVKFQISINNRSVKEIASLMQRQLYIADDITFNVPIDTPFSFTGHQFILEGGQFDIIDGYHRLLATLAVLREVPDFEFTFVLNIMNYTVDKACRYIAQRDKRNKITMSYSRALDTTDPLTIAIKRLNENSSFVLMGQIGRLTGTEIINSVSLQSALKELSKTFDYKVLIHNLIQVINQLADNDEDLFKTPLSFKQIVLLCCVAAQMDTSSTINLSGLKEGLLTINQDTFMGDQTQLLSPRHRRYCLEIAKEYLDGGDM